MNRSLTLGALIAGLALAGGTPLAAQFNPTAPPQPRGLGVSPSFNGWYQNPDGTYTLSFGYVNQNTDQVLTIPVGARNSVSPGPGDQGQPTQFLPGRQFGSFTVTVPADFSPSDRVVWTLEANGQRFEIPGGLLASYDIPALYFPSTDRAGIMGSRPPVLALEGEGTEARGPSGFTTGPLQARVGEPLTLPAAAWDEDAAGNLTGRGVTLRWYTYRGPAQVTFTPQAFRIDSDARQGATTVSFPAPGDYVLHVQAHHTDTPVVSAGHSQCCWTNGYVNVTVAP